MIFKYFLCVASAAGAIAFQAFAQGGFGEILSDEEEAALSGAGDEVGTEPKFRVFFNGDFESVGEERPDWDKKPKQYKTEWTPSAGGPKGALKLQSGCHPWFRNMTLDKEWTIITIQKGEDEDGSLLWSIGSGHGRGGRSFGLAGTGRSGVKLIGWTGRQPDVKLFAVRNSIPYYDKQFHVYAVVHPANSGKVVLYVDGKKAGEAGEFDPSGCSTEMCFGSQFRDASTPNRDSETSEIAEFRYYDTALGESAMLQIASRNEPWPGDLPPIKTALGTIDTNAVLRLGFELPENLEIGEDGEKKLVARGVLAQCGIGGEKSLSLGKGGILGIGSGGLLFDSNYAKGRTNTVEFTGGTLISYEPSFVKSMAPIRVEGRVRIFNRGTMAIRASLEGDGDIVKDGPGVLGIQYPCDNATGRLVVMNSTLVMGHAATWGGTVVLMKGTTLKCATVKAIKNLQNKGGKIIETDPEMAVGAAAFPQPATSYKLANMQREKLGRGVFAMRRNEKEVMVGWRYKSTDPMETAFNVYCNGLRVNPAPVSDVTYFIDTWRDKDCVYEVKAVLNGKETASKSGGKWTLKKDAPVGYFDIELTPPQGGITPVQKNAYGYQPYDCSVGDLDGDGEYELVIIWWPDGAGGGGDNTSRNEKGPGWLEAVKLDGTNRSLWKICLGPNMQMGSHFTPVMVYDFDGDGRAEVICRTADGTRDGTGAYIGDKTKDYRVIDSYQCLFAPNFLTVFDGRTGKALDTIDYKPGVLSDPDALARKDEKAINREWSSRNPGNQAFRFLACLGYFDGVHPTAVFCRGYYSRTCIWAVDWDGKKLKERWYFCSDEPHNWGYGGQGFHNLRVGDVDFDGKDEVIYGHMVVDDDGKGLYTTGSGHGDAIHLIQASPETRGLQVWTCHEAPPFGVTLRDAQTGRWLIRKHGPMDTGSCNAMDIDPEGPGVELFSGTHCGIYSAKTFEQHFGPKPNPKQNYYNTLRFNIRWLGDLTSSAYAGGDKIWGYKVGRNGRSVYEVGELPGGHSIHSTKGVPNLQADIFGDWREEIILQRDDKKALRLYMSPHDTEYRFHTMMEDPVYRISVATENNGYNVPPEPGFYFGPELLGHGIIFRGMKLK